MNRNAWFIVALPAVELFDVACVLDHKPPPPLPAERLVGYFAGWSIHRGYHVTDIPAGMLTHVIYAFDAISPAG
jgi:GH18 family chitinase